MAATFTGTVESVDTREFAPFRPGEPANVQVNLRLIESSGRLIVVETGAGTIGRTSGQFLPATATWPFLIAVGGLPVSTLYVGDKVSITGTLKGPERTSKKTGKPYQVINRAKVAAVLEHDGVTPGGKPVRVPNLAKFSAGLGRDLLGPQATIREIRREERDGMCPHGIYVIRGTDCDACYADQHPDQGQALDMAVEAQRIEDSTNGTRYAPVLSPAADPQDASLYCEHGRQFNTAMRCPDCLREELAFEADRENSAGCNAETMAAEDEWKAAAAGFFSL